MGIQQHKDIQSFLESCSNYNVHGISVLDGAYNPAGQCYYITCDKCQASYQWVAQDFNKSFGIDLDLLGHWCEQHKHGEEIKFPAYDPLFGSSTPWYTKPVSYPSVNPAADIVKDIQPSYKASSLQLDQMAMKKVWQWSGFNVDLQANVINGTVNKLRAVCKCGVSIPLLPYGVINNDPIVWNDIKTFCEDHRFCGTSTTGVSTKGGRKFKNG